MTARGSATLSNRTGISIPRDTGRRRTLTLLLVYLVAFGAVGVRLVNVQVVDADRFAQIGAQQRERSITLTARRGRLYDREGDVLATSVDAATVYADPRAFRSRTLKNGLIAPPASDAAAAAIALAPLLGRDADSVEALLTKDAHFVYLGRQLDWSTGEQITALGINGVAVLTEPSRVYPAGPLAAQVLGFVGIDGEGLSGLESQYNGILTGAPGMLEMERDGSPSGLAIASGLRVVTPAEPGTDLVLTIDREIQHVAQQAAAAAAEEFYAVGVSVVVLEVATGEVLAMASAPGYDPNDVAASDAEARRNRSVTDLFEPGSVQKAITAAAALEEGLVTADTELVVDDRIRVGNKTFTDAHEHEPLTMTFRDVIVQSSNVGTIQTAQRLGEDKLAEYIEAFGFGRKLGVGFPGESSGLVLPRDQWWTTSLPTMAIGQGIAMTLLQAAAAYATIANDGVAIQPRLLRGTVGEDGRLQPVEDPAEHRVIRADTAQALRGILRGVVEDDSGTGRRAAVAGYDIGGKTGTARKPDFVNGGYSGKYIGTFVGFAPVDKPRIVVAVMVDEPSPIWGGVTAAPVFAEVMEFALVHRRVPPTRPSQTLGQALDEADREQARILAERAAQQEGPAIPDGAATGR